MYKIDEIKQHFLPKIEFSNVLGAPLKKVLAPPQGFLPSHGGFCQVYRFLRQDGKSWSIFQKCVGTSQGVFASRLQKLIEKYRKMMKMYENRKRPRNGQKRVVWRYCWMEIIVFFTRIRILRSKSARDGRKWPKMARKISE